MNPENTSSACLMPCSKERRLLHQLFHESPLMLLIVDGAEHPVLLNEVFRRTLGWDLDTLSREGWRSLLAAPHTKVSLPALAKVPGWMDSFFRIRDLSGRPITAHLAVRNIGTETEPEWLLLFGEPSKAEGGMDYHPAEDLLEHFPGGILALDEQNVVISANQWALETLELLPDNSLGLPLSAYLKPLNGDLEPGKWLRARAAGVTAARLQAMVVIPPANQTRLPYRYVVFRKEPAEAGLPPQIWDVLGPALDLEVASAVLHHVRQPIHAASLIIESVMTAGDVPQTHRLKLEKGLEQCDLAAQALNDWAGLLQPASGSAVLASCLEAAFDLAAPAFQAAGVLTQVQCHIGPTAKVAIDPLRLTHAIRHIIDNALHAVRLAADQPDGESGVVSISASASGGEAKIVVRDSGIGFAQTWMSPAPPMLQSDWPDGPHRGVGLLFCRQTVQRAGGTISWMSTRSGSEVTLTIPLASQPFAAREASPFVPPPVHAMPETPPRILLVDDEAIPLLMADEYLKDHGYEVITAQDGLEALNLLQESTFDVLATDLRMPVLDGYSLIEKMKTVHSDIPVIILTAHDEQDRNTDAEISSVLYKPFRLEELLLAVQKAVFRDEQGG